MKLDDVVQLKSGGPPMIIRALQRVEGNVVAKCVWQPDIEASKLKSALFHVHCLKPFDAGEEEVRT